MRSTKWLLAVHLMAASKEGMSAHQLHRMIAVTYKTAWFMFHRIREAMRSDDTTPFGSGGGIVEVDETFIGKDPKWSRYRRRTPGAPRVDSGRVSPHIMWHLHP